MGKFTLSDRAARCVDRLLTVAVSTIVALFLLRCIAEYLGFGHWL